MPLDPAIVAHERAVLGALVTGALSLRDVDGLGEAFTCVYHARLLCVLVAVLQTRTGGRRGVDVTLALRACQVCSTTAGGALTEDHAVDLLERGMLSATQADRWRGRIRHEGYLPTLAREAPRRLDAVAACVALRAEAVRRWDVDRDRETLGAALADVLTGVAHSFLRDALEGGALLSRRGTERPIDDEAFPREENLTAWIGELMTARATRERAEAVQRLIDALSLCRDRDPQPDAKPNALVAEAS